MRIRDEKEWEGFRRLGGLRRFAAAITLLNLLGHAVFGFEQSYAQPLVALAAAYGLELGLEMIDSWANQRAPKYGGGTIAFVDFLLPAHITALAVSMLLYANDRLWVVAFASAVAVGSKTLIRVRIGAAPRHFLNPSNFGLSVTLLLFPWVGIAQPYQFTENIGPTGYWILPAIIVVSGTLLNTRFTTKLPLIGAWLGGFVIQGLVRSFVTGSPVVAPLVPMTGVSFLLFTFYMITDPATSPSPSRSQVLFGLATAAAYAMLVSLHAVFGMFFGLTIICAIRGAAVYCHRAYAARRVRRVATIEAAAAINEA
jgi:hypothetical protein